MFCQFSLYRFVAHILSQATKFAESPNSTSCESNLNGVRSCVVGVVAAQDETKADVIELNVFALAWVHKILEAPYVVWASLVW